MRYVKIMMALLFVGSLASANTKVNKRMLESNAAENKDLLLVANKPAERWQQQVFPLGNGTLGVTVYGELNKAVVQFTVDSLWEGNENAAGGYNLEREEKYGDDYMGAFQTFGTLVFTSDQGQGSSNYRRQLDIANALHTISWEKGGYTFKRELITSFPDSVLAWRFTTTDPQGISGVLELKGSHPGQEKTVVNKAQIDLMGQLKNSLKYHARVMVIPTGGSVQAQGETGIEVKKCKSLLVLLAADTNYVMDYEKGWMQGDPVDIIDPLLKKASKKSWSELYATHQEDHRALFDRVALNVGSTPEELRSLPVQERIANYMKNAQDRPRACLDPDLEELFFQYGRYLLIACSRPGTLPANLQGIWNSINNPAWRSDYHSNVNVQMNYWLAETTNLSELSMPLLSMLDSGKPVYAKHTKIAYGADKPGFVTRMSINPYGGSGWNWNIEGTAWLSQHYWTHYLYTHDKEFLADLGYPFLRDVSRFWLTHLKSLPNGRLVVPNVWSHEHGPYEDGTAHAQQLMWELFRNTAEAAKILNLDPDLQKQLLSTRKKLVGPKIGSWGQLMEWMDEKPKLEKGGHRHTSHLFALHPGNQISVGKTPEFAEAARVSLEKRGDSKRSWTWAWRTALWARLGDGDHSHDCIAGLLAFNTMENLWTTHRPYQIDGNYGISNGFAEMLLQCHTGVVHLLPALPSVWNTGSVVGLSGYNNLTVGINWKNGKMVEATLISPVAQSVKVRIADSDKIMTIKLKAGVPYTF